MEERIVDLEIRLAFHEKLVEDLNEVVAGQQRQLDEMESSLRELQGQLRGMTTMLPDGGDYPPPHY